MVSPALKCHATPLPLNVAQHAAAPTETGSHDASSCKLSIRPEACSLSRLSHAFRIRPAQFPVCPNETSPSPSVCLSLRQPGAAPLLKAVFHWLLIFFHQEKLAKSIHYLISKEDQVRSQITNLEVLINQTEVRPLTLGRKHLSCWSKRRAVHTLCTSLLSVG